MAKAKKPTRARAVRRAQDRDVEKLRRDIAKLYAEERGGSPERAITLASASQVEPDAGSRACPYCDATMRAESHEVEAHRGESLRVVRLVCRSCHAHWNRYYRLASAMPN